MTYYATVRLALRNHYPNLWPTELKTGTRITPAIENVHDNCGFF